MTAVRVRLGWAVMLLVVAGLGFTATYDGILAPLTVVLGTVVPFAVVAGGVRLKIGSYLPALIVVILAAGAAWLVLGASIGDALPRLLTSARPVGVTAELLTPAAMAVVLVASVVAACVLASADGGDRSGKVAGLLAPVVGAVLLYTVAQLLSAGDADPLGIVAACLVVLVVAGWSTPVVRGERVAWRPTAVSPLLATVVLAVGAGTLVPSGAFDPAQHVSPPTTELTASSPLTQLESWVVNPKVEILRTRITGDDRLHLAVLSTFSGSAWEVDDRYREVGLHGTPDLPAGTQRTSVEATVQITQLGGVWLPAPGTATRTTLPDALVDTDSGTLAVAAGPRPGLTYDVSAEVDNPSSARLSAAPLPTRIPQRYTDLPDAPPGFATYARAAVRGASTPLEEAVALEHAVSTGRRVSTTAPTGSSYGRLQSFLFTASGTAGAQEGSSEQFAAAFAVLARAVGLPTRLVVGFDVPAPAASGTSVVHGSDATVWPEVYFAGAGWVAFAPTPGTGGSGADAGVRDSVLQKVADNAAATPVQPPVTAGDTTTPPAPPRTRPHDAASSADSGLPVWVVVVVAAAALLVLLLALVAALRARRRARHRRGGAAGAWAEFVDLLVLLGRRPAPSDAAPTAAAAFDADFPHAGIRAITVARAADRVGFAPPGTPADQADLWRDVRLLRRRARGSMPLRRRALWPVDPRPLLRRD